MRAVVLRVGLLSIVCGTFSAAGIQNLWTGAAGDNLWSNPTNWSLGTLPNSTQDVVIGQTGTNIVLLSTSAAVAGFQLGSTQGVAALTITSAGSLSCFGPGILKTNASLNLAGQLQVNSSFIVQGNVNWTDGYLTASAGGTLQIAASGTLNVSGPNAKQCDGRLVNQGTVFCDVTVLYASPNTTFTNSGLLSRLMARWSTQRSDLMEAPSGPGLAYCNGRVAR